jgi:hypothetical protein
MVTQSIKRQAEKRPASLQALFYFRRTIEYTAQTRIIAGFPFFYFQRYQQKYQQ